MEKKQRKLLILCGNGPHIKVVEAAKKMGIYTILTDNLPLMKSPAKKLADEPLYINALDVDAIVDYCKNNNVDGVLDLNNDIAQKPFQQICERLGLPCFGTKAQYDILTDKSAFKKCCIENGIDVIPSYRVEDFKTEQLARSNVQFPVYIKPSDSRGSRGQTICYTYDTVEEAISFAKSESREGTVIIEKYMGSCDDICVTYQIVNGEPYLLRVGDRYLGEKRDHMDSYGIATSAPSRNTGLYVERTHPKVVKMLKNIGLQNAVMFMQGFVDGETVRFYDPALRFPGAEYERVHEAIFGESLVVPLIQYSLTGLMPDNYKFDAPYLMGGKKTAMLYIIVKPGTIASVKGLDEVRSCPNVVALAENYSVGDTIGKHFNVKQAYCEIDILGNSKEEIASIIDWLYHVIKITDTDGNDMLMSRLDTSLLKL